MRTQLTRQPIPQPTRQFTSQPSRHISGQPTPQPTPEPTVKPTLQPTVTLSPTNLVQKISFSPSDTPITAAPSEQKVASITVSQAINGINATQAVSPVFKTVMQKSIAKSVGVPINEVTIISLNSFNGTRRLLLSSFGVNIVYTVVDPTGNVSILVKMVRSAVSSGLMTNAIRVFGFTSASASSPAISDTSPTNSPTPHPTDVYKRKYTLASDSIIIGTTVGSFFFVVLTAISIYGLQFYLRNPTVSAGGETRAQGDSSSPPDFIPVHTVGKRNQIEDGFYIGV